MNRKRFFSAIKNFCGWYLAYLVRPNFLTSENQRKCSQYRSFEHRNDFIKLKAKSQKFKSLSAIKKFQEWMNEIPFDITSDNFRMLLRTEIKTVIGSSNTIVNVKDFGAVSGRYVQEEFIMAVKALPEGGTLIIPEGIWLINNLTIDKKIIIRCQGTLKRSGFGENDQTNSNHMVRLNAPCIWNGGVFDSNFRSWRNSSTENQLFTLRVDARSWIKNVHCIDCARRADGWVFGGFRNGAGTTLFEYCSAEYAARSFYSNSNLVVERNNKITDFKGVYYYKCGAIKYTQKGFDSAGNHGFIVVDSCYGELLMEGKLEPQEFILFETGDGNMIHSGIVKNTSYEGYSNANIMKSSNVKWTIFIDSHLANFGFGPRGGRNPYSSPQKAYRNQENYENFLEDQSTVLINSSMETIDHDTGHWYYNSNLGGKTIPFLLARRIGRGENPRNSSFYAINCRFRWKSSEFGYENRQEPVNFYASKSTFEIHNTSKAFLRLHDRFEYKMDDTRIVLDHCEFINKGDNNTYILDAPRTNIGENVVFIINPSGNFHDKIVAPSIPFSDSYR